MEEKEPNKMNLGEIVKEVIENSFSIHYLEERNSRRFHKDLGMIDGDKQKDLESRQEILYQELLNYKKD